MSEGNITTVKNFIIVGFPGLHTNYYGIVSAIMFLVYMCILIGNGIFLKLFSSEKCLRKPMYYIILNLVVCDVLFSTTTLPKIIARYWFNDGGISFLGCFIQMYFVHYLSSVNSFVLGIMAFDRYVAVCNPLRYTSIVKDSTIFILCIIAWLLAEPCVLMMVIRTYPLPYCSANTIINCYCDHVSITKLACTDRTPYGFPAFVFAMVVLLCPLAFILFSYSAIILAILRISTPHGRLKTLSTCSSQLIIIALFFLPRCFNYLSPYIGITFSPDIQILVILLYSLLPPMINPLIYCIRTKEVKKILSKNLASSFLFQFVKQKVHISTICN
ncbi:olfactory receptor 2AT4-like [Electrophorus electricus]|uniref:olfactory receptor 2AT4-like n=1 Tax=Electrophorus electricus TaxID=8005 RepID=UPI0015CFB477|nr:olfactory receptor 2AT4-like [Electrophorus electricus]XP_035389993.1 olfactory receptor 2AT4-like [Electrophorus electricus]